MFRWFYGGARGGTCQVKNHAPGSKRAEFSNYTMKTLGSGDVIGMWSLFNSGSFRILISFCIF